MFLFLPPSLSVAVPGCEAVDLPHVLTRAFAAVVLGGGVSAGPGTGKEFMSVIFFSVPTIPSKIDGFFPRDNITLATLLTG